MHRFCLQSSDTVLYASVMNKIKQILHFYCVGYQVYYYPQNSNIPLGLRPCGILHSSGSNKPDIQHSSVQYLLTIVWFPDLRMRHHPYRDNAITIVWFPDLRMRHHPYRDNAITIVWFPDLRMRHHPYRDNAITIVWFPDLRMRHHPYRDNAITIVWFPDPH